MDAHDEFPASAALSLMLAVIATSDTPLMLLAGDLTVIAASTSFCLAFDIDPASVPGKPVLGMGDGEWNVPQLGSLLTATASGAAEVHAYELDLRRPNHDVRHLVLNAHRLDYEDKVRVRLLLAVADVTDARASEKLKDDLIREKAVLLREVQHRIANSLQIIASVLLQSVAGFNLKRPVSTSKMLTTGSCRSHPYSSNWPSRLKGTWPFVLTSLSSAPASGRQ